MSNGVEVTALATDGRDPHKLRMLVTVTEDVLLSEARFVGLMEEAIRRIIDETVKATMLTFTERMNEVLSLEHLRGLVVKELQSQIAEVK